MIAKGKWRTSNGDLVDIESMTDQHIQGCIDMLVAKHSAQLDAYFSGEVTNINPTLQEKIGEFKAVKYARGLKEFGHV